MNPNSEQSTWTTQKIRKIFRKEVYVGLQDKTMKLLHQINVCSG